MKKVLTMLIITVMMGVIAWDLINQSRLVNFHEDEFHFISRGIFFDKFWKGEFSDEVWSSWIGYDQPKLGEMTYGLGLRLIKHKEVSDYLEQTGFVAGHDVLSANNWLEKYSDLMSPAELMGLDKEQILQFEPVVVARRIALVFSLSSILVMILIGNEIGNWMFGATAGFLLFKNSLFRVSGLRAMTDPFLLFWLLAGFWISLKFTASLKVGGNRRYVYVVLMGLVGGLATAVKLNGGMLLVYYLLLLVVVGVKNKKGIKLKVVMGLMMMVVNLSVFVFLNPVTWHASFNNMVKMSEFRLKTARNQQGYYLKKSDKVALVSFPLKAGAMVKMLFSADYSGRLTGFFYVNLGLFLWGLKTLDYKSREKYLGLWTVLVLCLATGYIPLFWERYYLPVIPGVILVQTAGIFKVLKLTERGRKWIKD